jgi:hypothetical protein
MQSVCGPNCETEINFKLLKEMFTLNWERDINLKWQERYLIWAKSFDRDI